MYFSMRLCVCAILAVLVLGSPLFGQNKRLWVLQSSGEMVEYDPTTFAPKQRVKVPRRGR